MKLSVLQKRLPAKHVLLAEEFIRYRPRLLAFHSLHVNAMKCIYVGFSLSKLQSLFWKISLNSRLIRLEGFSNKISTKLSVCSRGVVVKLWPGAFKVLSSILGRIFFSSLLFFSSLVLFFFFSFSFYFRYNSFVMFLYIAYNFWIYKFSSRLCLPFLRSPFARSCDLRISSTHLITSSGLNECRNAKEGRSMTSQ